MIDRLIHRLRLSRLVVFIPYDFSMIFTKSRHSTAQTIACAWYKYENSKCTCAANTSGLNRTRRVSKYALTAQHHVWLESELRTARIHQHPASAAPRLTASPVRSASRDQTGQTFGLYKRYHHAQKMALPYDGRLANGDEPRPAVAA